MLIPGTEGTNQVHTQNIMSESRNEGTAHKEISTAQDLRSNNQVFSSRQFEEKILNV